MNKFLVVGLWIVTSFLASCANSKAKAQEQVTECDVLFEYHSIVNDSISLMIGNTMRVHSAKTQPERFYPLLVSVRNPRDLDRPTSSEVILDDPSLLAFLRRELPFLQTIGVVISSNTSQDPGFSESGALVPIRKFAKLVPDSRILVFHELDGDVISVRTEKEVDNNPDPTAEEQ